MPYLVADDLPTEPRPARAFARCSTGPASCRCRARTTAWRRCRPSAAGFEALYLSGAGHVGLDGPARSRRHHRRRGLLLHPPGRARRGLPLLVDGDTGYGEALNVMHMVRAFEEAGAGAVHIEDQLLPKKCGHLNDKKLADPHDMAAKVAAAAKARRDLCDHRAHRCRGERRHRRRRRPRQALPRGWRRRDLPRGADQCRDVPRLRQGDARREAAGQHDRVRPHAILHRGGVRGDGLPHGDLAGLGLPRRQQGAGQALRRASSATAARRT